jgi:hypothetical protein
LSALLDVDDVLPNAYTLEVSSPASIGRCATNATTGGSRDAARRS